ncbi:MAG: hypothetical protein RLZZ502_1051, partial [Pseudomonadota bacterium]
AGFNTAMEAQRNTARAAGKFKMDAALSYEGDKTVFHGYTELSHAAKVLALYQGGSPVSSLTAGDTGVVVLDHTPFYAESGGQAGDQGKIGAFEVNDTTKIQADVFGHHGCLASGTLKLGDAVEAKVDVTRRSRTVRNHSATHLMHKALREVLGAHVQQKGSLVDADKTRFDFAHSEAMTAAQIAQVEELVNQEILANAPTQARLLPIEEAKKTGAMMLFGEKYGDEVRVLDIGSSRELCGGTHVHATGDIGLFKITSEGGVAAGVRRVEAVTGMNALAYVQTQVAALDAVASALRAPVSEVTQRLLLLQEQVRASEKEVARLKAKLAASAGDDLLNKVSLVAGVKLLAAAIEGGDAKSLRDTVDQLKNKLGSGVVLLASQVDGKVSLCAGVTADLLGKYKAGELVSLAAAACGGKGGGRPDMAMAGGTQVDKIDDALACAALYLSR